MTDTIEDLEQHACDAYIDTMSGTAFRETLYNTLAILELARQVRRIADSRERKPQAQAKDCPFPNWQQPQEEMNAIPSCGFIGRLKEALSEVKGEPDGFECADGLEAKDRTAETCTGCAHHTCDYRIPF